MFTTRTFTHRTTGGAAIVVALSALGLAACGAEHVASPDPTDATDTSIAAATSTLPLPSDGAVTPVPDTPDGGGGGDDGPGQPGDGGAPDGGDTGGDTDDDTGGEGGELEPAGDSDGDGPAATGPCADVLATGASLLVDPRPAVLPAGQLSSALTVTNCGADPVEWTAATVPGVALDAPGGTLDAGASTDLGFTIDQWSYEPGAIEFKIKVSEPGHNNYVDVQAFREFLGLDAAGGIDQLAAGPPKGCSEQCVVSAKLTANATSTSVGIHVTTNTPAMLNVYVSTSAPGEENGHPAFADGGLKAFSNGFVEEFSGTIGSLDPATDYHLILEAIDEQGNAWYGTTTFRTITPLDLPDGIATPDGPGGCGAHCITAGTVEPHGAGVALHVETHTPALMSAWISTDPLTDEDDKPLVDGLEPAADSGELETTEWDTIIEGLAFGTDYHIVVRARDLSGGTSWRAGTFGTADGVEITATFRTVTVVSDAEDANPGEISMAWGHGGFTVGTRGEQQIDDGTTIDLSGEDTSFSFVDTDLAEPNLMTPNVTLLEFDAQEITESCPWALSVWTDWAVNNTCGLRVNVATGIHDLGAGALDSLPRCSEFGLADIADEACFTLEAPNLGNDGVPVFWAVVSLTITG